MLLDILDETMGIGHARCGSLQVYNVSLGGLELMVHRGFSDEAAAGFRLVRPEDGTVCARAWRAGRRVSVPAVMEDPMFAPYVAFAAQCGFRAVQSTPIAGASHLLGVMSTHFEQRYYPSSVEAVLLDQWAARSARTIEEFAAAA